MCAVQDSFKHWTAPCRRIDYPIRHPRPTRPANQRTSRFETRGENHDNRNERGGMGDGGDPRRTPGLRCTLYHGGEFQADGYQRNGGHHRDGGFPPADASGLARGGVRARSRRVLPHRRVFFGSGALGGSLRGVSRLRVPRAFTLGRKPGRVRVLHRSFHVCRGPSFCGRAWPRTRVGDEARMAQAVIARARQSSVLTRCAQRATHSQFAASALNLATITTPLTRHNELPTRATTNFGDNLARYASGASSPVLANSPP